MWSHIVRFLKLLVRYVAVVCTQGWEVKGQGPASIALRHLELKLHLRSQSCRQAEEFSIGRPGSSPASRGHLFASRSRFPSQWNGHESSLRRLTKMTYVKGPGMPIVQSEAVSLRLNQRGRTKASRASRRERPRWPQAGGDLVRYLIALTGGFRKRISARFFRSRTYSAMFPQSPRSPQPLFHFLRRACPSRRNPSSASESPAPPPAARPTPGTDANPTWQPSSFPPAPGPLSANAPRHFIGSPPAPITKRIAENDGKWVELLASRDLQPSGPERCASLFRFWVD